MTKIMTFYTCMKIMYGDMLCANINPKKMYFRASQRAARIGGTTAYIKEGFRYSIYDLLVGLMLPSGNDASLVLAENFGRFLILEQSKTSFNKMKENLEQDPYDQEVSRLYIKRFVKRMNHEGNKLKLSHSSFSNSHGLSDKANKSSAYDVNKLVIAALKYNLFKEVVNKYQYISSDILDYDAKRPEEERA